MVVPTATQKRKMRDALLEQQGGICLLCGRTYKLQFMDLDHDHALEKEGLGWWPRGCICRIDNRAMGVLEWSDDKIARAIAYLQATQELRKRVRNG